LLVAILRLASANGGHIGTQRRPNLGDGVSAAAVLKILALVCGAAALAQLTTPLTPWARGFWVAVGAACVLYQFPFALLSATVIRWGLVKAAYYASYALGEDWQHDAVHGAACLAAVRAARSAKGFRHDSELGRWLDGKLRSNDAVDYNLIVATALFVSGNDPTRTRALLYAAERMPSRSARDGVRHLARRWLLGDAFIDGAYHHVLALGSEATLLEDTRSFALCARVKKDFFAQQLSRSERLALALLRPPKVPQRAVRAVGNATSLGDALRALMRLRAAPSSREAILAACEAWGPHLDETTRVQALRKRTAELGGRGDPEEVFASLRSEVGLMLVAAMVQNGVVLDDDTGLPEELVGYARQVHLDRLGEVLRDLQTRLDAGLRLERMDEVEQAGRVMRSYLDATTFGGASVRAAAYPHALQVLCNYGVALDNHGYLVFRALAHAIFQRWHDEATAMTDPPHVKLMQRNCAATA
jgi:hypothetical protein